MMAWMAYATALGAMLWAAAEGLARTARARGRPERWIWAGSLAGSVLLPALLPLLPRASAAAVGTVTLQGIATAGGVPGGAAGGVAWIPAAPVLVWALASLVLLVRLGRAGGAVRRVVANSPLLRRLPVEMRLAGEMGPAVAGAVRPVVLLPSRFPALPFRVRRWILRHELEHVRAGDPALVWAARICQALVPWNPMLWILGRRLREGVEFDCDRRVLGSRPDPRSYGETLLSLVSPSPAAPLPVAAFREPFLSLERRILAMTTPARPLPLRALLGLGAASALVLAAACELSPTFEVQAPDEAAPPPPAAEPAAGSLADDPVFTPYTVAPNLRNRQDVVAALEAGYPPLLRDAGIGGTANVWFFIDRDGTVGRVQLQQSSGHPALDAAALDVARTMRFTPARNRDEPVPVWVAFPITFQTR
ncbi:MAG TPA: M56 family metallopeptidase [Longimicrobiales bacterium]|nr:M56 family metallopeptidase [Longimicrobiales bacterium]